MLQTLLQHHQRLLEIRHPQWAADYARNVGTRGFLERHAWWIGMINQMIASLMYWAKGTRVGLMGLDLWPQLRKSALVVTREMAHMYIGITSSTAGIHTSWGS